MNHTPYQAQQHHQLRRTLCKQTGLSIRGRSWQEAGCLSPDLCNRSRECDNGEYAAWEKEMDERIDEMHDQDDDDEPTDETTT